MKKQKDLPQVLVLKRTFVQRFPNGQQVALYHSDILDQYITIPLDNSQFSNTTESIMDTLESISTNDTIETIVFDDISELTINKECADLILEYAQDTSNILDNLKCSHKEFLKILENAAQYKSSTTKGEIVDEIDK